MHTRRLALIILAIGLGATACDSPNVNPPGTAPLRYRDTIFTETVKTADVAYGSAVNLAGQTVSLTLDVYAPPASDPVTQRPAIVWIHGGGFSSGTKTSGEIVDQATTLAKAGYVNFSIKYRLEPAGCSGSGATTACLEAIREAREDAQTAVRWVRSHATEYGVDPSRIAAAGTSAGAITALNVGYFTSESPDAGIRAAVSLSGASILSPITAGDAPALLLHGTVDTLVPYAWAVNTVESARGAGLHTFLTTWDGDGHVPYVKHRAQILEQTRNFLWWEMDLAHAAGT